LGEKGDLTPIPPERHIAELADSMTALLATPAPPPKRPIGFIAPEDKGGKKASSRVRFKD